MKPRGSPRIYRSHKYAKRYWLHPRSLAIAAQGWRDGYAAALRDARKALKARPR